MGFKGLSIIGFEDFRIMSCKSLGRFKGLRA